MRAALSAALLFLLACPVAKAAAPAEPATQPCPAAQAEHPPAEFHNMRMLQAGIHGWLFARRDMHRAPVLGGMARTQLAHLAQQLEAQGTHLVIALLPQRILTSKHALTASFLAAMPHSLEALRNSYFAKLTELRAAGVMAPDLLTPLEQYSQTEQDDFYFKRDHHWTPDGARATATALAHALLELPAVQSLPAYAFTSYVKKQSENTGSYARFLAAACKVPVTPEVYGLYETRRSTAPSLLDDAVPDIVLMGTSFSSDSFNFGGFLAEALGRDVQTVSVDGGGTEAAITAYLTSDGFVQNKPRILIWEMPALYPLDTLNLCKQHPANSLCNGTP